MRNFRVLVNGNEYRVAIEELTEEGGETRAAAEPRQEKAKTAGSPRAAAATPQATVAKTEPGGNAQGRIVAAMPGTILNVLVDVGDKVEKGQSLLVLEAMKMENEVMAPDAGVVKEISVAKGASVNSGDLLMVLA